MYRVVGVRRRCKTHPWTRQSHHGQCSADAHGTVLIRGPGGHEPLLPLGVVYVLFPDGHLNGDFRRRSLDRADVLALLAKDVNAPTWESLLGRSRSSGWNTGTQDHVERIERAGCDEITRGAGEAVAHIVEQAAKSGLAWLAFLSNFSITCSLSDRLVCAPAATNSAT